jgi:hypothetical protein
MKAVREREKLKEDFSMAISKSLPLLDQAKIKKVQKSIQRDISPSEI